MRWCGYVKQLEWGASFKRGERREGRREGRRKKYDRMRHGERRRRSRKGKLRRN